MHQKRSKNSAYFQKASWYRYFKNNGSYSWNGRSPAWIYSKKYDTVVMLLFMLHAWRRQCNWNPIQRRKNCSCCNTNTFCCKSRSIALSSSEKDGLLKEEEKAWISRQRKKGAGRKMKNLYSRTRIRTTEKNWSRAVKNTLHKETSCSYACMQKHIAQLLFILPFNSYLMLRIFFCFLWNKLLVTTHSVAYAVILENWSFIMYACVWLV